MSTLAYADRAALVRAAGMTIRDGSRSFYTASRLFAARTRERSWLLYCWCRHCDDICDDQFLGQKTSSRHAGVEDIDLLTRRTLAGDPPDALPYQALAAVLGECDIPHRLVLDHLRGFALDQDGWRPQSEEDLVGYCYHVAGAVGRMMAVIMGVTSNDERTLKSAEALGISFQLTNIVRDIRDDRQAGRCYLPRQWLARHGIDEIDLLQEANRDALVKMSGRLTALSQEYEARALEGVWQLPFRSRWAVLAAAGIYGAIGRRVTRLGAQAWDGRVIVPKIEKFRFLLVTLLPAINPVQRSSASQRH